MERSLDTGRPAQSLLVDLTGEEWQRDTSLTGRRHPWAPISFSVKQDVLTVSARNCILRSLHFLIGNMEINKILYDQTLTI